MPDLIPTSHAVDGRLSTVDGVSVVAISDDMRSRLLSVLEAILSPSIELDFKKMLASKRNSSQTPPPNQFFNGNDLLRIACDLSKDDSANRILNVRTGLSASADRAPGLLFFAWLDRPALTVNTLKELLPHADINLSVTAFGSVHHIIDGADKSLIAKHHKMQRIVFDHWLKFMDMSDISTRYIAFDDDMRDFSDVNNVCNWFMDNLSDDRKNMYCSLARKKDDKRNAEVILDRALRYLAWHLSPDYIGDCNSFVNRLVMAGASDLPFVQDADRCLHKVGYYDNLKPLNMAYLLTMNGVHSRHPAYNGPRRLSGEPDLVQLANGLERSEIEDLLRALKKLPEGRWAMLRASQNYPDSEALPLVEAFFLENHALIQDLNNV